MQILTETFVERAVRGHSVTCMYGGEQGEFDCLIIAAGRGPDVEALGLADAGVQVDEKTGLLKVDGQLKTTADGVWAIGDIVPGPVLAHKASDEGIVAVESSAGMETNPLEYADIPRATFCTPNVASFGLTEGRHEVPRAARRHVVGAKSTELIQVVRQRQGAGERISRAGPHGPWPPDAVGGGHGGRACR
jgi:pyruvate/2-oxoglutarate dehydrogenase complex dihydrolipoamide dehydrogenase (E3) component